MALKEPIYSYYIINNIELTFIETLFFIGIKPCGLTRPYGIYT